MDDAEEQKVDFKISDQLLPILAIDKYENENASPSPVSDHSVSRAVILVDSSMDLSLDLGTPEPLAADVKDMVDELAVRTAFSHDSAII